MKLYMHYHWNAGGTAVIRAINCKPFFLQSFVCTYTEKGEICKQKLVKQVQGNPTQYKSGQSKTILTNAM